MPKREASDVYYGHSGAQVIPRGGAKRIQIIASNIDAVSNAYTVYGLQYLSWHYPDLLAADNYTFVYQNIGGTLGTLVGADVYTSAGHGAQLYASSSPEYAGIILHDTAVWSLECFFRTGSSVTGTLTIWADYSVYPTTGILFLQCVNGVLHLLSGAGTNIGPAIAVNTTYHLILVTTGATMTWFVNAVTTTGSGPVPAAVAVGTTPAHQFFVVGTGWQIGFLTLWHGIALSTTQQTNHYNFMWTGYLITLIDTQTIAASGTYKAILGEYGTLPLPERLYISWVGNFVTTVEQSE